MASRPHQSARDLQAETMKRLADARRKFRGCRLRVTRGERKGMIADVENVTTNSQGQLIFQVPGPDRPYWFTLDEAELQ